MVGQLYPKGDGRIDGAFTIFYMGINLGAFFAPLICGGLGDTGDVGDFKWGFLAAGVGMIISVITFEFLKNKYIIDPDGQAVGLPPSHYKSSAPSDQKEALPTNYGKMGMIVLIGVVLVYVFHNFMGLDLIGGS